MKFLAAKYYKPGSLRFSPPPPHSHSPAPPPPSSPLDLFSPLGYFSPPAPLFSPTPRSPPSPPPPFSPSCARPPVCTSAFAPARQDGESLQPHNIRSLKEIQTIKMIILVKIIKEDIYLPLVALSLSNSMTELCTLL